MAAAPGKVALVTGANKGLGFETARQLGQRGIAVLIGARDEARGAKAAAALRGEHIDARWIALDVTQDEAIAAAAHEVGRSFGKLDILVNNAGIGLDAQPASTVEMARLRAIMDTNFFGAFATTKAMLPAIRKAEAGRIVNVSSAMGCLHHLSDPQWAGAHTSHAAYCMSKTALNMMTVQFARELWDTPIKVNAVEPGYTATDLTQHQGHQTPEDAVKVIVRYAMLPESGPTGGYFDRFGRMPW